MKCICRRERVLDLLRPVDALVRLVELPALARRVHERLQADDGHRDEQQRDDQEGEQQLGVNRGADAGDPAHESGRAVTASAPARQAVRV